MDGKQQDLAWRFVDLFVEEARGRLVDARAAFEAWMGVRDPRHDQSFRRHAHSLRGMSATLGLTPMADVARRLETRGLTDTPPERVREALARLGEVVEAIAGGEDPDQDPLRATAGRLDD